MHGVDANGAAPLKRKLRRNRVLDFFRRLVPCLIGLEACAGAHVRARELAAFGHEVRIMPASCVKPYVKRGKTDPLARRLATIPGVGALTASAIAASCQRHA